jgi:hypothetical protein
MKRPEVILRMGNTIFQSQPEKPLPQMLTNVIEIKIGWQNSSKLERAYIKLAESAK